MGTVTPWEAHEAIETVKNRSFCLLRIPSHWFLWLLDVYQSIWPTQKSLFWIFPPCQTNKVMQCLSMLVVFYVGDVVVLGPQPGECLWLGLLSLKALKICALNIGIKGRRFTRCMVHMLISVILSSLFILFSPSRVVRMAQMSDTPWRSLHASVDGGSERVSVSARPSANHQTTSGQTLFKK